MSYNVITSKHDSERITEAGTLFEEQQLFVEIINLGEGELKMSNLWPNAFVKVSKRILNLK